MATAERKARKRAGVKFERKEKVATPIFNRSIFAVVWNDRRLEFRESAKARRLRRELAKIGITEGAQ